ncbi:PLP-dependent transferase [Aspergillus phoenicis ATCC 13157]|uniref:PLP-dependent transferase n=1 Tax=Aspergillus phoenicis ATCC 13157 TaxID=1353007 RepID=A0A370P973_ASPPH|nr:PLP-dependent transferase [Aspergillus phoenicis ATCC 13157]
MATAKEAIKDCEHEYLPILGHPEFRKLVTELVFKMDSTAIRESRVASCQALSGTGALHMAGMMLMRTSICDQTGYITNPSWSNHRQLFESVGFSVREFNYASSSGVDMQSLFRAMTEADPMSIFVLHASAHNPSGWDPTPEQWRKIGALMKERTLFPLFDAAYLGLTSDNYDEDAYAIRYFAEELNLQMGVCISFAKSMGMYAFGAGIVATVLGDGGLFSQWQRDLATMSSRITGMRKRLFSELTALGTPGYWKKLTQQKGMFCVLGLTPDQVHYLKKFHHIYMAESSRISIAGLNEGNVRYVAECIHQIVCRREE